MSLCSKTWFSTLKSPPRAGGAREFDPGNSYASALLSSTTDRGTHYEPGTARGPAV